MEIPSLGDTNGSLGRHHLQSHSQVTSLVRCVPPAAHCDPPWLRCGGGWKQLGGEVGGKRKGGVAFFLVLWLLFFFSKKKWRCLWSCSSSLEFWCFFGGRMLIAFSKNYSALDVAIHDVWWKFSQWTNPMMKTWADFGRFFCKKNSIQIIGFTHLIVSVPHEKPCLMKILNTKKCI